jgi:hypothetical protein
VEQHYPQRIGRADWKGVGAGYSAPILVGRVQIWVELPEGPSSFSRSRSRTATARMIIM